MAEDFALGTDPEAVIVVKKTKRIRNPVDIVHDPDPHDNFGKATAIGKDGNRDTSSIEFRPGRSSSGMDLVNRTGDLVAKLGKHYHPPGIAYKAGAYWDPEPLGGHVHFSWQGGPPVHYSPVGYGGGYADRVWQVCQFLSGMKSQSEYLIPLLFEAQQVQNRKEWASANNRPDFAHPLSFRPETLEKVMANNHVEYRYPPSWLDSPEAAYCFLGGAECIVREILSLPVGKVILWDDFVRRMYTDPAYAPPKSPPLSEALETARRFVGQQDFMDTWLD